MVAPARPSPALPARLAVGTPGAGVAPEPGLAHDLEVAAARLRRVTVVVGDGRRGTGAGVVWRADGIVVTNAHVVTGHATVTLADGRRVEGRLLARDERRDLAALRLFPGSQPGGALEVAARGNVATLRVGQLVLAVGHPLGQPGALSVGIVHAAPPAPSDGAGAWIVADLRLRPGNSGGPLGDERGRVVGINARVHGGLALAVPTAAVVRFLDEAGLAGP